MFRKIRKYVHNLLKRTGYQVRRYHAKPPYSTEYYKESLQAVKVVQAHSMLSFLKLATLYEQVVFCEKQRIEGAFVECGVWKGGAVGIMALANLKHGTQRRSLHLFDVFDDICEPDPVVDGKVAIQDVEDLAGKKIPFLKGRLKPISGVYNSRGGHGTVEICRNLIVDQIGYDKGQVHFHKGWFQDTLISFAENAPKIALLRLDADWYASTKVCLDQLFDLVVPGGFIIIDDYGRYDGCKKAVDEFLRSRSLNPFLHYADYGEGECRYFIKS